MQITIPHKHTKQEAIAHVKSMLEQHAKDIAQHASDVKTEWNGDVLTFGFTAQGSHIEGTLTITDHDFDVYAKLPLMLRMFEGRIEKMIKEQIEQAGLKA